MSHALDESSQPVSQAGDRIIVALDFPTQGAALALIDRLENRTLWVKIGLELYLSAGAGVIDELRKRGLKVFLDLKLHDIPNTVAAAVRVLSSSGSGGPSLLTVHAGGGLAMMAAAEAARAGSADAPQILGVTVLTSMDAAELEQAGVSSSPQEQVLRLARLAAAAKLSGIVCSAQEAATIRAHLGPSLSLVVPGIRLASSPPDDQRRTASAGEAIRAGASMLVIGRPITAASDPGAAFDLFAAEVCAARSS